MRVVLAGLLLLAGCTLYENKPGGGPGDDMNGGGDGSNSTGPVGRSFFLTRVPQDVSSCPSFAEENQAHAVDVAASSVTIDGTPGFAALVRPEAAREGNDAPNVSFDVFEEWRAVEGSATPNVHYEVWVDGGIVTGTAATTFLFNSTDGTFECSYFWRLANQL